jgi:GH18 family chitinase
LLVPFLLNAQSKWVNGYVASWDLKMTGIPGGEGAANVGNMPYTELDYDALTHITIFNINLTSTGTIDSSLAWDGRYMYSNQVYNSQVGPYVSYIHTSHPGKVVLIDVWPSVDGISTAGLRTASVRSVLDFMRKHQFDGVDFDCETGQSTNYPAFFHELYDSLQLGHAYYDITKKQIISVAMTYGSAGPAYTTWADSYQWITQINVMSYDGNQSYQVDDGVNNRGINWHTCAVYAGTNDKWNSGAWSLTNMATYGGQVAEAGVPKSKIGVGLSVNGYTFTGGVTKHGSSSYGPRDTMSTFGTRNPWNETRYYTIKKNWAIGGADYGYDNVSKVPYIRASSNNSYTYYTFVDTTTAWYAAKIVKDSSFGGMIVWTACSQYLNSTDYPSETNRNPMLRTIKNTGIINPVSTNKVIGYLPYWWNGTAATNAWHSFTHVIYVNQSQPIATAPYQDFSSLNSDSYFLSYRDSVHAHGGKFLFEAIGGYPIDADWATIAGSDAIAQAWVDTICGYAKAKGCDGIELDLEFPTAAQSNLVFGKLRKKLDTWSPKGILMMASYYQYVNAYYNADSLNAYVDIILPMTYTMWMGNGEGPYYSGFDTPVHLPTAYGSPYRGASLDSLGFRQSYNTIPTIRSFVDAGILKSKIVVSISFEGTRFSGVTTPNQQYSGWGFTSTVQHSAGGGYPSVPASYTWDDVAKGNWAYSGGYVWTFHDTNSIKAIVKYAQDSLYSGIMVWDYPAGYDTQTGTVLADVLYRETMQGSSSSGSPGPAPADTIKIYSGNNQAQAPSTTLNAFTVLVTDSTGAPFSGQSVSWAVASAPNGAVPAQSGGITMISGQNTGLQFNNNSTTIAFPNSVTSGNTIIVTTSIEDAGKAPTIPTITKSSGTATIGTVVTDGDYNGSWSTATTSNRMNVFRVPITGSGTLTLNISTNGEYNTVSIAEYSGFDASPVDGAQVTNSGTSSAMTTGNVTLSQTGMIVGFISHFSTGDFNYSSTSDVIVDAQNGGASGTTSITEQSIRSAGAHAITATTGSSWAWGALAVKYKATAAVAGYSLSVSSSTSGADGKASTTLTMAPQVGNYTVTATATGLINSPLSFTATAQSGASASVISLISGNNQSANVSTQLSADFVVKVVDTNGDPYVGQAVTWAISSYPGGATGQSLSATNTTTGVGGTTNVRLTLGSAAGTYQTTATATGLTGSPITFSATGSVTQYYLIVK